MATIDKRKSQTFQKITRQEDINDVLKEENIKLKERHDGLTVKFSNDIINNNTNNQSVNNDLSENHRENLEPIANNLTNDEKEKENEELKIKQSDVNFDKFKYNAVTIFEDKKISKLRQKIHNQLIPELDKKTLEKNQLLSSQYIITSDISKIKKELLELRNNFIEKKMTININATINKQKITDNEIRNISDLEIDIEKKQNQLKELEKNKRKKEKEITKIKKWIEEKENNINKIKSKLNEYDNKLNIPSAKPDSWFNKSDLKIELEKDMVSSNSRKEKEKISKKISQLDEEMRKIWNGKKVEKIYEEILSIEDKIFFITTFQHIDNSITEKILYFDYYKNNNNLQVINQTKNYKNINYYKKDINLINAVTINSNYQYAPIKEFLNQQEELKSTPTWSEIGIWIISWLIIPLAVAAINLIHPPFLVMSIAIGGIATVLRGVAELFSPASKKVWSWISNKCSKNNEEKENGKKEHQSIIKKLTSDTLKTRLQTKNEILKQELDNKKDKKWYELINNETINHTSNNISENLDIESENNQNFDSSIRNTVNNQDPQPSTSTKIHHSNSVL